MGEEQNTSQSRVAAALLLSRLQSLRSALTDTISRMSGTAAEHRLAAILDQVAGAEGEVSQALQSGGRIPIDLSAIERLIAGSEAAGGTAIAAGTAEVAGRAAQDIAATYQATRHEVQNLSRDLFERRIFDADLKFNSAEEETAYRAREAERQKQIAEFLAQRTPEGDLLAGGLTAGQMLDAGTHGATANPEFLPRWNRLVEQLHRQREAMLAEKGYPQAIQAFDRQIRQDVRRALEQMGVSAAQIDRVASSEDPLRAATPFLNSESARALEARLQSAPTPGHTPDALPAAIQGAVSEKPIVSRAAIVGIIQGVDLAAIGVTASPTSADTLPSLEVVAGHGLPDQVRQPIDKPSTRTPG